MLYEIKRLIKRFDQRVVLDLKDLVIDNSSILSLLGPNGSGKTTLLEILAFISSPSEGEISFKGKQASFNHSEMVSIRQKVVLVQQRPLLFTTSVYKNVEYPLKIRKIKKSIRENIVNELLSLVGMSGFIEADAHRLSGGETQRVAIAQALACSPEVILLDEPTSSVDIENQYIIERIIRDISREKKISVIFTTHDMIQASRIADKTVFLYDGKITDSIHENIFNGVIKAGEGKKYCLLTQDIRINMETNVSGNTRISINPKKMCFHRERGCSPGNENCFTGKLVQLTDQGNGIRAIIDIGLPVSVLMDYDRFKEVNPGIGAEVYLEIPGDSIEII